METGAIEASLRRKGAPITRSISQAPSASSGRPRQGAGSSCRRDWSATGSSAGAPSPEGSRALSTGPISCIDGIPAGYIENFRDGQGPETWRADIGHGLAGAETKAQTERIERSRALQARGADASQGSGEDGGAPVGRRLRCAVQSSLSHQERRRRTWLKATQRWPPDRPAVR